MVKTYGAVALLVLVCAGSAGLVGSLAIGSSSPALPSTPAMAGSMDYYLKIDGLDGPSMDQNHKGWFDVTYFQHGTTMPVTVQGKMTLGRMVIVRPSDTFSAALDEAALARTTYQSATIECIKGGPGGKVVLAAKLSDVTVSSVRPFPKPDGTAMTPPMEKDTLNFSKFEWTAPKGGYQMKYPSEGEACPQ